MPRQFPGPPPAGQRWAIHTPDEDPASGWMSKGSGKLVYWNGVPSTWTSLAWRGVGERALDRRKVRYARYAEEKAHLPHGPDVCPTKTRTAQPPGW